uniref:Uncharacterized protein n=1 Tax=Anguilla anguilla TaxID=7936 RepID=A0A0E9RSP6_ANGAN
MWCLQRGYCSVFVKSIRMTSVRNGRFLLSPFRFRLAVALSVRPRPCRSIAVYFRYPSASLPLQPSEGCA